MEKKRGLVTALAFIAVGALVGCLACGEETPVTQGQWEEAAVFPGDIYPGDIAVGADGAPYFPSYDHGVGVVFRYAGGRLEEVYRAPYDESAFEAVGAGGGAVWVGGSRRDEGAPENSDYVPYIVRYAGGRWEELAPPVGGIGCVYACDPVSRDFCWVTFSRKGGGHALYSYDHGAWRERLTGVASNLGFNVIATPAGRVFVDNGHGQTPSTVTLLVSDDDGARWEKETVAAPAGYAFTDATEAWALADGSLYLVAWTYLVQPENRPRAEYIHILRRDGAAAGAGAYEEVFSHPRTFDGEYIDVRGLAFKGPTAGCGAGSGTGVRYINGSWQLVRLAGPDGKDVVVNMLAANGAAYWGLGGYWDEGDHRWVLFKTD